MTRWYASKLAVLAVVWTCSAVYLPRFVERGWIPHDEGAFAHSAERVLQGELPHRDFDEIYTGGLSYLHAVGFELFGIRLVAIRLVLLGFALAFVPAFYGVATRFASPPLAGLVTLLGVAWSLPNYFAGVPSWYNLFFATFGTLALLRHLESGRAGWLWLAGVCGGLSILVKITGVYFVAAALLFLVYREEILSCDADPRGSAPRSVALGGSKALLALVLVGGLTRMIWGRLGPMELVYFVLPGTALGCFLVWSELRDGRGAIGTRIRTWLRLVVPFALGVALPMAIFLIPYLRSGAVGDLVRGVFVLPARRVESASFALPPLLTVATVLPYALLLLATPRLSRGVERALAAILTLALGAALVAAGTKPMVYQLVWDTLRPLVPLATIAGCLVLARSATPPTLGGTQRQALFLVIAVAALVSLVQFPYAFAIYFCYAAPAVAIALLAIVSARPAPRLLHLCVLGFYFLFALLWLNTAFVRGLGLRYIADGQTSRLTLERAGLLIYEDRKQQYERLIALVQQHAGPYVYAAPDAPEIYFLSARRNPTRTIYDIFDESEGRTDRILRTLDAKDVKVVVINRDPEFSPHLDPGIAAGLTARFPHWEDVGRFRVAWRE